jgi:hypothetical protein
MHVSGWLNARYAEKVIDQIEMHREDVAKLVAEPAKPLGRPRRANETPEEYLSERAKARAEPGNPDGRIGVRPATIARRAQVRAALDNGRSIPEIAEAFGVSQHTIRSDMYWLKRLAPEAT